MRRHLPHIHTGVGVSLVILCLIMVFGTYLVYDALRLYHEQLSVVITDRSGVPVIVSPNARGHYALPIQQLPPEFIDILLTKEDRYFRYHPGINPVSTTRALYRYMLTGRGQGGSTITQQLAKNLLGTENDRTVRNKIREMFYAFALEVALSKDDILIAYANSVYMGNQIQGFETASRAYFDTPLRDTTNTEQMSLLATLSYPTTDNPWAEGNTAAAARVAQYLRTDTFVPPPTTTSHTFQNPASFELTSSNVTCSSPCTTTIDVEVTRALREILNRRVAAEWKRGARNGAIVVIDPTTSELIAMIGSKDPHSDREGDRINMALAPRPVGSTIKPLIYLRGFDLGLRPYTLVEDREYKYPIATGFSLYPKNFDGMYHGTVTLHEALANSFNVPTVKVLEWIGLTPFYAFLLDTLHFEPIQELDQYQYGIALGGLEMDLLTLTHYYTVFPRGGTIAPLKVFRSGEQPHDIPPQSHIDRVTTVSSEEAAELVHAVISDRLTGVEQFGLRSTLNIPATDYGVKTGTSRDFHDSWVVGYTGDFVVGVWLGNVENEPLEQLSGQAGAGAIWNEAMSYLLTSHYNKGQPIRHSHAIQVPIERSLEWGLSDDDIPLQRELLRSNALIRSPHAADTFSYLTKTSIPLRAVREAVWTVNGTYIATGTDVLFHPDRPGSYEITATDQDGVREIITISVITEE